MELKEEYIDELIAKYLSGEALPDEALLLDDWKRSSAANMQYFNECSRVFAPGPRGDIDMQKLYQNIMLQADLPSAQPKKVFSLGRYLTPARVAAAVIFAAMGAIVATYYLKSSSPVYTRAIAAADVAKETTLEDGSRVFLNKHTKLQVQEGFNKNERRLKLEGEAFFEVKHDAEKPFVIDAGGVEIRDIGTAFNIKASPASDSVSVFVTEGIVDITNGNTTLRLEQNESAVYIRSRNELMMAKVVSTNITSYKTKVFRFRSNTLGEVVDQLNAVYGNMIGLTNPALSGCMITVDFNNESPETIVSIIAETLGLTYQKKGDKFELTGSACIQ